MDEVGEDTSHNFSLQPSELESLDVSVFNEDDIEQKVAKDFELKESKAILEATESLIALLDEKLEAVNQQISRCENSLQTVCENGGVSSRKCKTILNEQERLSTKRADLLEKRSEAHTKRDKALLVLGIENEDDNSNENPAESSKDHFKLPSTTIHQKPTLESTSSEKDEAGPMAMPAESEQEKDIRLGMMTSFGTVLKSQTGNLIDGRAHVNFEDLNGLKKETASANDEISLTNEKTKKRRLSSEDCDNSEENRKRTRMENKSLETATPEFKRHPQLDESSHKSSRTKVKSGFETDDSDWDYSSDNEDNETIRSKKRAKTKHDTGKILDDGDRKEYINRLEDWHESRTTGDIKSDSIYEELEGGLRVPKAIWTKLYHYQRVGVQWLWELDQQKVGGILGDEMGLGKTIQIVAFIASLAFSQKKLRRNKLGLTLVVCPTTVMFQWAREFHEWWPPFRVSILHESGSFNGSKLSLIRDMCNSKTGGGILITSFNAVIAYQDALHQEDFDYVILDEGHKIRNPDAQITLAVKQFSTSHRLILSGSPLQNNLKELWSLFDFIYPGKLGTLPVFMQQFSVPITIGGYSNASKTQVATAYKCATILRDTINPYLLRRMKSDVQSHIMLPAKSDQVLFCKLTEEQRKLYQSYLGSDEVKNILDGRYKVFMGLTNLRKICNHPDIYDGGPKHIGASISEDEVRTDHEYGYWKRSGKMIVVEALLKLWKKQNHKVLLFSQSKQMLLVLEKFVRSRDYSYMKMDGQTSIGSRQNLIKKFNENSEIFLFLLTTKVGGLGVNLTGADRVVIFDPDWNPSTDTQARERAWRIGQNKEVTIYRLLLSGTIEEKIYHRQIFKQLLINRVLKDPTQRRFFKANDLHDLFSLSEGTSDKTETSALFAGTGSEVKPKSSRYFKKQAEQKRLDEEKKIAEEKLKEAAVAVNIKPKKTDEEALREKVRLISQKITKRKENRHDEKSTNIGRLDGRNRNSEGFDINLESKEGSAYSSSSSKENQESGHQHGHRHHHHKKHHKHKKSKSGKFEGHRISHLVKSDVFKGSDKSTDANDKEREESEHQDQYVLSKLFKKSGVHSAVKHDMIVEGGGADFALIEGEAEKVAKDAVNKLRESRRLCFRAESGLPTWTGNNGVMAKPKKRFGKKDKSNSNKGDNETNKVRDKITAQELLHRMRKRNGLAFNDDDSSRGGLGSDTALFQPDSMNENVDLLTDIRNFIAFQAESTIDGEASTDDLVKRFKDKLPSRQNPLFKALLNEICIMYRDSKGKGVWRLKPDFR